MQRPRPHSSERSLRERVERRTQERDMQKDRKEKALQRGHAVIDDLVGLPPGDKTPHGKGRPDRDLDVPQGDLTSDDPARRDGTTGEGSSGTDE
jgi:hypothetical protein